MCLRGIRVGECDASGMHACMHACMRVRMRSSGSGWHGFGGEDRCDDYGAVPDSPERRCVGGFARRRGRGRPRCGVAVA